MIALLVSRILGKGRHIELPIHCTHGYLPSQRDSWHHCRDFPSTISHKGSLVIVTDASPWGIGGVLMQDDWPVAWFADDITTHDLRRFRAKLGDSALTTLWEVLALLVAMRTWSPLLTREPCISVKADSLSALRVAIKFSSKDRRINAIARELALDSSAFSHQLRIFRHIPGFSNFLPDCLSRLTAPHGSSQPFPEELSMVARGSVAIRDFKFWKTWSPPS